MATSEFHVLDGNQRSRHRPLPPVQLDQTAVSGASDYLFGRATPLLAALLPDSQSGRAEARKELHAAGYYCPHAITNFAAIRYLCMITPLLTLGLLLIIAPRAAERPILVAMLILPAIGWALPRRILKGQAVRRIHRIEAGIPDLLDLVTLCVSQGMTAPAALARIATEIADTYPDLETELKIVSGQAALGSLEQALGNLRRRIDGPEIHSFTTLLMQTEQIGSGVLAGLAEYGENVCEGLGQRAEEQGNHVAFQLLFPIVLCLVPSIFLILMGPAVVASSRSVAGDAQSLQRAGHIPGGAGSQGIDAGR